MATGCGIAASRSRATAANCNHVASRGSGDHSPAAVINGISAGVRGRGRTAYHQRSDASARCRTGNTGDASTGCIRGRSARNGGSAARAACFSERGPSVTTRQYGPVAASRARIDAITRISAGQCRTKQQERRQVGTPCVDACKPWRERSVHRWNIPGLLSPATGGVGIAHLLGSDCAQCCGAAILLFIWTY